MQGLSQPTRAHWCGLLLTWIGILSTPAASAASPAEPASQRVDALFATFNRNMSPGCAVGVTRRGSIVYGRGFGAADIEEALPLAATSVFYVGSMAKQFTAASIRLLEHRGSLRLEDDVRRYLPELPSYDRPIRIRHLLFHTSGIRDYLELLALSGRSFEEHFDNATALALIVRQRHLNFSPGSRHLYSNSNYVLLAEVIERVTGRSLRKFTSESFFAPLGMRQTHFADDRREIVKHRAHGYELVTDHGYRRYAMNIEATGDGNLLSTVADLARWDRALQRNRAGFRGLARILAAPGSLDDGTPLHYASGLMVESYRGERAIGHAGSFLGYRSQMLRFPARQLTVICLCNLRTVDANVLARRVADIYLGADSGVVAGVEQTPRLHQPNEHAALSVEALSEYAGVYRSEEIETTYTLLVERGRLRQQIPFKVTELASEFTSIAPDTFDMGVATVTFVRDPARQIIGLRVDAPRAKAVYFAKDPPRG